MPYSSYEFVLLQFVPAASCGLYRAALNCDVVFAMTQGPSLCSRRYLETFVRGDNLSVASFHADLVG